LKKKWEYELGAGTFPTSWN